VSYVQLAHNERHRVTWAPSATVIHNFGRTDVVDRDALARLVASISRFLDRLDRLGWLTLLSHPRHRNPRRRHLAQPA
jgi:hypothetical protein